MMWLIGSYVFLFIIFNLYRLDVNDTINLWKRNHDYVKEENKELRTKLKKIYNKIDRIREN